MTYIEGPFHVHVKESNLFLYLNTTGCTGTPGKKAPPLKVINAFLFVHVPSGNIAVCGQSSLELTRSKICFFVFWRELESSLLTNIGCAKFTIS